MASLLIATTFTGIEATFTKYNPFAEAKDHALLHGHTTFEQWYMNVLYAPVGIIGFHYVFTAWATSMPALLFGYGSPALAYVLVYPINIWLLEIVMGYFCTWIYGRNVAWKYSTRDSLFHGNIRLLHAPYWSVIGAILYISEPIVMPTLETVCGNNKN